MSNRGFKGFRKPETITPDAYKQRVERLSIDGRFIYWTGNPYRSRKASLRSNCLATVTEKRRPISLKVWLQRCATVVGPEMGYTPDRAREGLYLHRGQKPSVYFELEKDAKGNYVSVNDIPAADGYPKGLKRGQVVIEAQAEKAQPSKGKGQAKQAQIEAPAEQPAV